MDENTTKPPSRRSIRKLQAHGRKNPHDTTYIFSPPPSAVPGSQVVDEGVHVRPSLRERAAAADEAAAGRAKGTVKAREARASKRGAKRPGVVRAVKNAAVDEDGAVRSIRAIERILHEQGIEAGRPVIKEILATILPSTHKAAPSGSRRSRK
jgi:hypothetical protein